MAGFRVRTFCASDRCIEGHGGGIASIGQDPCNAAIVISANFEERAQHGFAQSAPPVCGRDGDFVDPQLRLLVWMDIVDARCKADGESIIDGNGDVMAWVGEKFCG